MGARGKLTPGRIGDVALRLGEPPHVIRYWEREFNIRPTRSSKGQRCYSAADVEKLRRVRRLLRVDGYTIAGAWRVLEQQRKEIA